MKLEKFDLVFVLALTNMIGGAFAVLLFNESYMFFVGLGVGLMLFYAFLADRNRKKSKKGAKNED